MANGPPRRTLADRLWERVNRSGDGCWEFTGGRNHDNYGIISAGGHNGRMMGAHRAAWTVTHGPIPEGLVVCHKCDNPPCCRPDHLFLGTHSDNMKDAAAKGRIPGAVNPPRNVGEANGRAKLDAEAVRSIRAAYKTVTAARLASEYGVSTATVYAVGQGRIWQHVTTTTDPVAGETTSTDPGARARSTRGTRAASERKG